MLDSWLAMQPRVRELQYRTAQILKRSGLRANGATLAALGFGVAAAILFACGVAVAAVAALALSAVFDALDGTIARAFQTATPKGGILDLTVDRAVEAAVLLGIVWRRPELAVPALVLIATWYVNITVFLATGAAMGPEQKLIHYPPGLLERTEAIILLAAIGLFASVASYLCYGYAALGVVTAGQRLLFAFRQEQLK